MENNNKPFGTRISILIVCILLLIPFPKQLTASEKTKNSITFNQHHIKGGAPRRIILNLTANPSTSQAVTWRTKNFIESPIAQISIAASGSNPAENCKTIYAAREIVTLKNLKKVHHYSAVFKHLLPDTRYVYRVGADGNFSEWNLFRTAQKNFEPFSFIYFGDPQNQIKSRCSLLFRGAYKKEPNADFWLFVGDLVNRADSDKEWGELFSAFGWISATTPMILLPGNHEYPYKKYMKKGDEFKILDLWRPQFTLPENGPEGLEETSYFIDYQGVRFIMLNGNEKLEEQSRWLNQVLSKNSKNWTIAAIHQPFYSTTKERDNKKRREIFVPVFDKYHVDLVLQGHDHTYCRSFKLRNDKRVDDDKRGTVYVISVSGPKSYPVSMRHDGLMAKVSDGRQLYQVIRIDKKHLTFQAFDVKGDLFDSFTLYK